MVRQLALLAGPHWQKVTSEPQLYRYTTNEWKVQKLRTTAVYSEQLSCYLPIHLKRNVNSQNTWSKNVVAFVCPTLDGSQLIITTYIHCNTLTPRPRIDLRLIIFQLERRTRPPVALYRVVDVEHRWRNCKRVVNGTRADVTTSLLSMHRETLWVMTYQLVWCTCKAICVWFRRWQCANVKCRPMFSCAVSHTNFTHLQVNSWYALVSLVSVSTQPSYGMYFYVR